MVYSHLLSPNTDTETNSAIKTSLSLSLFFFFLVQQTNSTAVLPGMKWTNTSYWRETARDLAKQPPLDIWRIIILFNFWASGPERNSEYSSSIIVHLEKKYLANKHNGFSLKQDLLGSNCETHTQIEKEKSSGQRVQTTIPECPSSYLPLDRDTEARPAEHGVQPFLLSDSMFAVRPKGEEAYLSADGEIYFLQKLHYWLT